MLQAVVHGAALLGARILKTAQRGAEERCALWQPPPSLSLPQVSRFSRTQRNVHYASADGPRERVIRMPTAPCVHWRMTQYSARSIYSPQGQRTQTELDRQCTQAVLTDALGCCPSVTSGYQSASLTACRPQDRSRRLHWCWGAPSGMGCGAACVSAWKRPQPWCVMHVWSQKHAL